MPKKKFPLFFWSVILCAALLMALGGQALARQTSIRIFHMNDFHGFAEPYQPFGSLELEGGAAYLAGRLNQLRQEKPSLLLAAGDMIQGDNWANLFQGASVIELMNAMGFDAMEVGNHEFDFGQKILQERLAQAKFPVLGANVQGLPGLKPYVIKTAGDVKVGIIGVITADTGVSTHPKNVEGLTFTPPEAAVQKYLEEIKPQVDLVVVLSHLGFREDRKLAQEVPGIHVIVGGHSHTKLTEPARVNGTIIVQAYEHAKVLGVLDLTLENGKITAFTGRLEAIKPNAVEPDPAVLQLVKKYADKVDAELNISIGVAEVDLDGDHVRRRETNFGNLVTDAMRARANADLALINGGSIRTSIPKGEIIKKQLYTALPYKNYVVALKLKGRQIKAALEHGVSQVGSKAGRFPQVSGLKFSYRKQAPVGKRVQEIFLDDRPLELHKEYTLATNDFLAAGGDGYRVLADVISAQDYKESGGLLKSDKLAYNDPGTYVADAVIDYIKARQKVAPQVEGRIQEIR
jgi:2',3'-cyclic-nucleotide 2'-phosphodiesterase (5'-nucleotidase family)